MMLSVEIKQACLAESIVLVDFYFTTQFFDYLANNNSVVNSAITRVTIFCPHCKGQHIDEGRYAVKPHKIHLCSHCGKKFRVANPTIGVKKGNDETLL